MSKITIVIVLAYKAPPTYTVSRLAAYSREPDRIFPERACARKGEGKIRSGKTCQVLRIHWNFLTYGYKPPKLLECNRWWKNFHCET